MTHTSTDQLPLSTTTNDTCGKENQNTSCSQHAQHDECNMEVGPDETTLIAPPSPFSLPNEIMALIFSYITNSQSTLYACTLANKRCYDLANLMLWKAPTFDGYSMATRFRDCMLAIPYQRRHTLGRLIHDIRLIYITWTKKNLSRLLPYMPNLQHLTLANCNNHKTIHQLPRRLTSLKLDSVFVTESGFNDIAQCPLEEFEWTLQMTQSPVWLTSLARCPLRRLSIEAFFSSSFIPRFDRLRNFPLTAADIAQLPTTPFSSFLVSPSTFPKLIYLGITRGTHIYDPILAAFINNHPHLEDLHLSYHFGITDTTLDAMGSLSRLTKASLIHIELITSPAVRRLINACPLTYLDVSGCKQVVPSDFPELSVSRMGVLNSADLDRIRASV